MRASGRRATAKRNRSPHYATRSKREYDMKKLCLLVCATFLVLSMECCIVAGDWFHDLEANLKETEDRIRSQVRDIQKNVEESVQSTLKGVEELTEDIEKHPEKYNMTSSGSIVIGGQPGGSVLINGNPGVSNIVTSYVANGKTYIREIQDTVRGNTLYHTMKITDPQTRQTRTYGYTLDLNDPNAKMVPLSS